MEAILTGKTCFLATSEWRSFDVSGLYEDKIAFQLMDNMIQLPALFRDIRAFLRGASAFTANELLLRSLRIRAGIDEHAAELETATMNKTAPKVIPSATEDKTTPKVYRFKDSSTAKRYTIYWTMIILANKAQHKLHPTLELQYEIREAARKICMSCEYAMTTRPLGSLYMSLPLYVAFAVSSPEQKIFVHRAFGLLFEDMQLHPTMHSLEVGSSLATGDSHLDSRNTSGEE